MRIAACLIVKDAAKVTLAEDARGAFALPEIERCLASSRPYVDEVCIYDTGSTDGTPELIEEIADRPGCPVRVERGTWRDDFAWAREQSFAMASPEVEWIVWLDSDDIIEGGENLRGIVALLDDDVDVVVATYLYGVSEHGEMLIESRARIIRRGSGCEWRNVVHETIDPPVGRELASAIVNPWMLRWVHRPGLQRNSTERNDRLLDVWEQQTDGAPSPRLLAERAKLETGAVAAAYLERYLEVTDGEFSTHRLKAWSDLSDRRREVGDVAGATVAAEAGERELATWEAEAAAGRCAGAAVLTPSRRVAMRAAMDASRRSSLGRNDPCWCRSGSKLKKCHGEPPWEPIFVRPVDVLPKLARGALLLEVLT